MSLVFALLFCPPLMITGIVLMFRASAILRAISKIVTGYDSPYGWTEDGKRPYNFIDYSNFIGEYISKTGDRKTVRRLFIYHVAALLLLVVPLFVIISHLPASVVGLRMRGKPG